MEHKVDLMGKFKRLNRVNNEWGSMRSEERVWLEHTEKESKKLEAQARVRMQSSNTTMDDYTI